MGMKRVESLVYDVLEYLRFTVVHKYYEHFVIVCFKLYHILHRSDK